MVDGAPAISTPHTSHLTHSTHHCAHHHHHLSPSITDLHSRTSFTPDQITNNNDLAACRLKLIRIMFSTSLLASALTHTILLYGSSSFYAVPICKSSKQFTSWQRSHHLFATDATKPTNDGDCDCTPVNEPGGPDILKPFLPAMDPKYSVNGPVGQGDFILSRTGPPTPEELSNEQMLKIVKIECNDLEVNTLVWKCMGYRFNEETESWDSDEVFPNWREKYPTPPDLIGMQRVYEREVDQISLRSTRHWWGRFRQVINRA